MQGSVLLVEDDPNLGLVLQEYLNIKGFTVTLAQDGVEGFAAFRRIQPDICVLDVMMPRKDGFELAGDIRQHNPAMPIIFLTAKSMKEDKIEGFRLGADDYVTKPFSAEELLYRIQAVLRRCRQIPEEHSPAHPSANPGNSPAHVFSIGTYTFDYNQRLLLHNNEKQTLTTRECELLRMLCQHKNVLLRRDLALKEIWGEDNYFNGRSMDVFITKLRKYMREDQRVEIVNIHGSGYKLMVHDTP
jgi:DNA-binding response OmpR family regulator